ncbi:T9SS type B sorting domain-containing protein [Nonlabens ponticola]|nr:T9SS type B sorting domain-containing protein [Nonlabens ponticola]
MPTSNNDGNGFLFVGCNDAVFTDSGGSTGDYDFLEDGLAVFTPAVETDRMILEFTQVDILANDVLTIYDGDSTNDPILATITNTTNAPTAPFQASDRNSNPSGSLTVRFRSNSTGESSGWVANRTCFDPCQDIQPVITTVPAIDSDGVLRICQGDQVEFTGDATFSNDGTGATYEWNLDNGRGFNTGQVQNETYTEVGIYRTQLRITDTEGCQDRDIIDLVVQVSNDPDFAGTRAVDDEICLGDSTTLTGVVNPVEFRIDPAPPVTGQTFLPDGNGVSYETCIDVEIFSPGQRLTDPSDLDEVFINIEHSFIGDLSILLRAPNGSTVTLLPVPNGGGATYLGQPIDDDETNEPGNGFEYRITERAGAAQTLRAAAANFPSFRSLPSGDYRPEEPFSTIQGTNLNGEWCLIVTDNEDQDNGYIFEWGLTFNESIIPDDLNFTPTTVREEWQTDATIEAVNGNEITVRPDVVGAKCYTYEYEDNFGCVYTQEVCIEVNDLPQASDVPVFLPVCNVPDEQNRVDLTRADDIILDGQANNISVNYFRSQSDADNDVNVINDPEDYAVNTNNEIIFARITDASTGCYSTINFELTYVDPPVASTPDEVIVCDDGTGNGFYELSNSDAQISNGQTNTSVRYYETEEDANQDLNPLSNDFSLNQDLILYARLQNSSDCFDIIPLSLDFTPAANSQLAETAVLCRDNDGVLISGPALLDTQLSNVTYNFEWRVDGVVLVGEDNSSLSVESPGRYAVQITDIATGCQTFDQSVVRQAGPPETFTVDLRSQPFDMNQTIVVEATGPDEYRFQLDDGLFQNSGTFNDVRPGLHTITIAEVNGCGSVSTQVFVYGYPDFFTPNADNFNDTWNVVGGDLLQGSQIFIFDRYGKFLKELSPTGPGWDGTFNGEPLPSSDYWFKIKYLIDGRAGEAGGHFALKR